MSDEIVLWELSICTRSDGQISQITNVDRYARKYICRGPCHDSGGADNRGGNNNGDMMIRVTEEEEDTQ